MKLSRIIYGLFVVSLIWAYFQPWTIFSGQSYPGWATILPFTFFYFLGLVIAIIVLFTEYRAVGFSILSGVFMFGNCLVAGILFGLVAALNHQGLGNGFAYAFFLSLIFLILGPICGSRFDKSSNVRVAGDSLWSKVFWTVIVGGIVSVIVALILKYVFNIG